MSSAIDAKTLTLFEEIKRHESAIAGNPTMIQILQHKRRRSDGVIVGSIMIGGITYRCAESFSTEHALLKAIGDVTEFLMRTFINTPTPNIKETEPGVNV